MDLYNIEATDLLPPDVIELYSITRLEERCRWISGTCESRISRNGALQPRIESV